MSQLGNGADLLCNFDFRFVGTGQDETRTVDTNRAGSVLFAEIVLLANLG